jgi:hypothetical protein
MAAIAQRLVVGDFAAAKENLLRLGGFVFDWRKLRTRVRAIAKGLLVAFAASAPVIAFASFNIDAKG